MRTKLLATTIILLVVSSTASAQQAKTTPAEGNGAEKTKVANIEFRWMAKKHEEGLTDPTAHRTICPSCPANHISFAHKNTLGVARHMTALGPHPAVQTRCAVELTFDDAGIAAIDKSAAKVKKYTLLGVFVGGEFVGVLSQKERTRNSRTVLLPSAKHVERLYTATNAIRLKPPVLLARFRFDGDMKDSSGRNTIVTIKNAVFKENSLYVHANSDDSGNSGKPEAAIASQFKTPAMNDARFTVAMRFKAFRLRDPAYRTLLCGGANGRWFRLASSEEGKLLVSMNNDRFNHATDVDITSWKWHTVVCEFDLGAQLLKMRVDGKDLDLIHLPPHACRPIAKSEKVWTFVNKTKQNSAAFHGLVDELIVYDGAFWPKKLPDAVFSNKPNKESKKTTVASDEKPIESPQSSEK